MNVSIHPSASDRLPEFSLGILEYTDVAVSDSPKKLQGRINLYVESLKLGTPLSAISEIKGVQSWRSDFKKLGIDPSRYRPSSEALLRRLLQGNPFFWLNSAVDVNNFLSVYHALPYGIYDRKQLSGSVVCRIGTPRDTYLGLNGREMDMQGKLLLADEIGAFGSPIVDSARSKVTEQTTELLQVIFFHSQLLNDECEQILGSTARMFTEINGGEIIRQTLVTACIA